MSLNAYITTKERRLCRDIQKFACRQFRADLICLFFLDERWFHPKIDHHVTSLAIRLVADVLVIKEMYFFGRNKWLLMDKSLYLNYHVSCLKVQGGLYFLFALNLSLHLKIDANGQF